MARQKLVYRDFRPLQKGELGYSSTSRRYVSPSTGEIISVRKYQQLAHAAQGTPLPKPTNKTPRKYIKKQQTEKVNKKGEKKIHVLLTSKQLIPLLNEIAAKYPTKKFVLSSYGRGGQDSTTERLKGKEGWLIVMGFSTGNKATSSQYIEEVNDTLSNYAEQFDFTPLRYQGDIYG